MQEVTRLLRVAPDTLENWVADVFARMGARPGDAAEVARHLVFSDLRGIESHGTARVPIYVKRIDRGGIDPTAVPTVERDTPASALVNGHGGLGHAVARFAADLCTEKALRTGLAAVALTGGNHAGCMGYYTLRMAQAGLVGFATTNATPIMPPWGSRAPYFGTNPIAFAVPAGAEAPLCYDGATSVVAKNRINNYARDGKPVPEGWATDRDGRPTTDPVRARDGYVVPMGGYKGSGLAFVMDVLSGLLTGPFFGAAVPSMYNHPDQPMGSGAFFWAFRPDLFTDPAAFRDRMDQAIRAVRALPPAPGFTRVLAPGDPELEKAAENRRLGIALGPGVLREFAEVADRTGVHMPWSGGAAAAGAGA